MDQQQTTTKAITGLTIHSFNHKLCINSSYHHLNKQCMCKTVTENVKKSYGQVKMETLIELVNKKNIYENSACSF